MRNLFLWMFHDKSPIAARRDVSAGSAWGSAPLACGQFPRDIYSKLKAAQKNGCFGPCGRKTGNRGLAREDTSA
ncbi:hypothetical protein BFP70_11505 [Thioclava sp. SK-1]|nr:hypothetical protein BFP70_11505 [Thioclava sp. SK-1]